MPKALGAQYHFKPLGLQILIQIYWHNQEDHVSLFQPHNENNCVNKYLKNAILEIQAHENTCSFLRKKQKNEPIDNWRTRMFRQTLEEIKCEHVNINIEFTEV